MNILIFRPWRSHADESQRDSLPKLVQVPALRPLTRPIPLAMLAGILLIVSCDMGEWREIPEVIKARMMERAEFHGRIASENLRPSVEAALTRVRERWSPDRRGEIQKRPRRPASD